MQKILREFEKISARVEDRTGIKLKLLQDEAAHDGGRHYARIFPDEINRKTATIRIAPEVENLETWHIRGILWHEVGHVLDEAGFLKGITGYSRNAELRADEAAADVFNVKIVYDPKVGMVQSTRSGPDTVHPRPKKLR